MYCIAFIENQEVGNGNGEWVAQGRFIHIVFNVDPDNLDQIDRIVINGFPFDVEPPAVANGNGFTFTVEAV